jgi:WD40 repeat protein
MKRHYFILLTLFFSYISTIAQDQIGFLGGHEDDVEVIALAPNGEFIATGSYDNTIHVYLTDSMFTYMGSFTGHKGPVTSLSFSRDGKYLISGSQDKRVIRWEIVEDSLWAGLYTELKKKEEYAYHSNQIVDVKYGPGMRMIFSADVSGTIVGYDIEKNIKRVVDTKNPLRAMEVSADRRFYFVADNTPVVRQLDILGKEIRTFEEHTDVINDIAVSLNRQYMVTASSDKTAIVWNLANGKVHQTLKGHTWKVTSVDISPDSKYVVTCSNDGGTIVWDINTGEKLQEMSGLGYNARSVAMTGDNSTVITALHFDRVGEEGYGAVAWATGISPKSKTVSLPAGQMTPAMRKRLGLDKKKEPKKASELSPEVRKRLGLDKAAQPKKSNPTPPKKKEEKKKDVITTKDGVEISVEESE